MTEHTMKVLKRQQELEEEALDKTVSYIEIRKGQIQTGYKSGRVVTSFTDKRKKDKIEYRGSVS